MFEFTQQVFFHVFGVESTSLEGLAILAVMEVVWGVFAFVSVRSVIKDRRQTQIGQ